MCNTITICDLAPTRNEGICIKFAKKNGICSIHKSGTKCDPRGIALLNCISRLFTTVLLNRLNDWPEMSLIHNAKLQRIALFACFVDFSKAFDNVNHNLFYW